MKRGRRVFDPIDLEIEEPRVALELVAVLERGAVLADDKSGPAEVAEVLDQWLAPDHRYFKVLGSDGALYILRHDSESGLWDLTLYQRFPQMS